MNRRTPPYIDLQQRLERRILKGLALEWEHAVSLLEVSDRRHLHRPLFSLRDMRSRMGFWSADKKEIAVSRRLAFNSPWNAVREILLHETAHQYAVQVLGADNERPHGPAFRKACRILKADPGASGRFRHLNAATDQRHAQADATLRRIQKLMSLAHSRNPHEAAAALEKAKHLSRKYNIAMKAAHPTRRFVSVFLGKPALIHRRDEYLMAHLLQDHYAVQAIWVCAYVLEKEKMGRVLEISGTPGNVEIAGYVYDFMRHTIESQWERYNRRRGLNRYRRTDFACGLLDGYTARLNFRRDRMKTDNRSGALIQLRDPQLDRYMKQRYPHTRTLQHSRTRIDPAVVGDGYAVGRRIRLKQGVSFDRKRQPHELNSNSTGARIE